MKKKKIWEWKRKKNEQGMKEKSTKKIGEWKSKEQRKLWLKEIHGKGFVYERDKYKRNWEWKRKEHELNEWNVKEQRELRMKEKKQRDENEK